MSRLGRFFVILIVAYTVAGCSPIGSIGSGATDLLVVPNCLTYNTGERFMPKSDLEVLASYGGALKTVSLSQVKINIAENPYLPNDLNNVPLDKGYILETAGIKLVFVEYLGMSTSYSIEVSASTGEGSTSGVHVKWPD